jgi:LacI family transcriptional regulator
MTIVLPAYEMGQRPPEALIDMALHGQPVRPITVKVDGPVVRNTTAGLWPS